MHFGPACTVRCVKLAFLLCFLNVNANAKEAEVSHEFQAYENKLNYCNELKERKIETINDAYFNSLNDKQKNRVISILYFKATDKCVAYEEAAYFKYVIRTQEKEGLENLKLISFLPYQSEETIKIINSLDQNEIERLSNSEMFSTPFDMLSAIK